MKKAKPLIILVVFIITGMFSTAQTRTIDSLEFAPDTIPIKFQDTPGMPKYCKVTYGRKYVLKIDNINLSMFKVEGSISQKDFNTQKPEIFKAVALPGYLNLRLPAPANLTTDGAPSAEDQTISGNLQNLIEELKKVDSVSKRVNATGGINNELKNLMDDCSSGGGLICDKAVRLFQSFLHVHTNNRDALALAFVSEMKDLITFAENTRPRLESAASGYFSQLKSDKRRMESLVLELQKRIEAAKKPDAGMVLDLKAYQDTLRMKGEYYDSVKVIVDKAVKQIEDLVKFRDENKIHDIAHNFRLINPSTFTYYSKPLKAESDEVTLDFTVSHENPVPCNTPSSINYSAKYKTKGGLKIDFSSGIFLNSGSANFMGRELQYRPVKGADTLTTIEAKDGGKRLMLSVGALMHIYCRSGKNLNFAFSPGLSTTTGLDGLNFHLGASAIFGNENRFVLSAGLTLRESKILDKNYALNTQYEKKYLPETVPLIKVFPKTGFFIAFTYNWSKFSKE